MYKNEKTIHSTEICGWRKTNIHQSVLKKKRKILFFLLSSCHSFDTEVNVFFPRRTLINKSVPVVLWPRGRFFQSYRHSQSWLLLSWKHLASSTLDLHLSFSSECFSTQPVFMPRVLWPRLFLTTQNLLFVFIAERHALVLPHTGIAGRVLLVRWLVGAGFWGSVAFDPGCFY